MKLKTEYDLETVLGDLFDEVEVWQYGYCGVEKLKGQRLFSCVDIGTACSIIISILLTKRILSKAIKSLKQTYNLNISFLFRIVSCPSQTVSSLSSRR